MGKCSEDFFAEYGGLLVVLGERLFDFVFGLGIEAVDEFYDFGLFAFDSSVLFLADAGG